MRPCLFLIAASCAHAHPTAVPPAASFSTRRALDGAVNCLSLSAAMQTCAELARDAVAVDEPAEQPVLSAMVQAALTLYLAEATHVATARAAEHPAIARATGSFPTRPARRVASIAMFQNSHN